jgi:polyketide biosynthesis enoyl-CoA hydratase PksI
MDVVSLREVSSGVFQLTMEDRQYKNTFTEALTAGLIQAFATVRATLACKVVVMTGFDTYFASGGTQEGLLALHENKGRFSDNGLYSLPLDCEVPVVAAMQGHGIGGGFVFGLFSDIVVLSRESVYTTNFMKYGFTPGMGATCVLPAKLGLPLAQELLMSARSYRGAELEKRGVPFTVLPRAEVLAHAHDLARELAEKPRLSLITLKTRLVSTLRAQLPEAVERELEMHQTTFHQPEVRERIAALFGK